MQYTWSGCHNVNICTSCNACHETHAICMSRKTCNVHAMQHLRYACHATHAICMLCNTSNMHVTQHKQFACHATHAMRIVQCISCNVQCNSHHAMCNTALSHCKTSQNKLIFSTLVRSGYSIYSWVSSSGPQHWVHRQPISALHCWSLVKSAEKFSRNSI